MAAFWSVIAPAARIPRQTAERIAKDIPAADFGRLPPTQMPFNHPAFNIGHLCLYPAKIAGMIQLDLGGWALPSSYEDLFKAGSICEDDPEGTCYPHRDELITNFCAGHDAVFAKLEDVPDEVFLAPMPDPARVSRFPTIGTFIFYLLLAHSNWHLGQVSAWRKCMGISAG